MRRLTLIAAIDERLHLGKNNGLLCSIPNDLKRFRARTIGHTVVMGRRTWASIGRSLPQRHNVVLSRHTPDCPGATIVHSIDAVRAMEGDVYVIGGGDVYAQFLPYATHMELTHIGHTFDGDVVFPEWTPSQWDVVCDIAHSDTFRYRFVTYARRSFSGW
ncbi:MAG: dihydrofolate reductase [Paenibacillaceae bacterium]|nr:dihydrofolate reductase [Paenibacillaceae bacterium]